jgi:Short repeat of unknown function (DUF308)
MSGIPPRQSGNQRLSGQSIDDGEVLAPVPLTEVIPAFPTPTTFAAIADILGFLFLLVGIFWIIEAFASMDVNSLWWLTLLAGILMVILGFYTGGEFFIDKAFDLLAFAGIWALITGNHRHRARFPDSEGGPTRLRSHGTSREARRILNRSALARSGRDEDSVALGVGGAGKPVERGCRRGHLGQQPEQVLSARRRRQCIDGALQVRDR